MKFSLRADYVVPLAFVVFSGLCVYFVTDKSEILDEITVGSSHINISGRQRMRSQQLSFLSTTVFEEECADVVHELLDTALEEIIETDQVVSSFCVGENCEQLSSEKTALLDEFVSELSSITSTCRVFEKANRLLSVTDELVFVLESETIQQIEDLRFVVTAVELGSAFVLFGMTVLYRFLSKRQNAKSWKTRDQMIQYLFHEIRNPLNHVVNGIEFVLKSDETLNESTRSELQKCSKGGCFITTILNDVLTLASIESKNHIFNTSTTSISQLLEDTAHVTSLSSSSKNTTVLVECDPRLALYGVDVVKLSQVLMNLATNAVKYAGFGKTVVVGAKLVKPGSSADTVCFFVSDNGGGISPETQFVLFDRFKTFSRNSGSGIGLHISQLIVKKMGGQIKVTSPIADGGGTSFDFTLSLTKSISQVQRTIVRPKSIKKNVRILVGDDEMINCVILERKFSEQVFTDLNWSSDCVITLEEVLAKATSTEYDVILLDEHFGNSQKGSVYIKTLREHGVKSLVFIASANCSETDNELYVGRGAIGTIPKPTPSAEVLLQIISAVV